MHTEYRENDVVRVTCALSGNDPYFGDPVSVPAGQGGTVVLGSPGRSSFDVEFLLQRGTGAYYSAILTVQAEDMEPYKETATH